MQNLTTGQVRALAVKLTIDANKAGTEIAGLRYLLSRTRRFSKRHDKIRAELNAAKDRHARIERQRDAAWAEGNSRNKFRAAISTAKL